MSHHVKQLHDVIFNRFDVDATFAEPEWILKL